MCYPHGSLEQVTRTCVMCKVNPPKLGCPHQPLGLCRNRQVHPRFDVVHFKNVDLELFDGCGYCKWAPKHAAVSSDKPWANTGFPGCCRPPKPNEYHEIKSMVEWMAVHVIHGTPIPLEALQPSLAAHPHNVNGSPRNSRTSKPAANGMDKTDKTSPILIPNVLETEKNIKMSPPRSHVLSSSPQECTISPKRKHPKLPSPEKHTETLSRSALVRPIASSSQNSNPEASHRARGGESSSRPRKSIDGGVSSAVPSLTSTVKSSVTRNAESKSTLQGTLSSLDGRTVTSDGFTDYLSDESDQELQRQAEVRAAEIELAKQETEEFDAALQTVRHLSLQPPPEWNNPRAAPPRPKPPHSGHIHSFHTQISVAPLTRYA